VVATGEAGRARAWISPTGVPGCLAAWLPRRSLGRRRGRATGRPSSAGLGGVRGLEAARRRGPRRGAAEVLGDRRRGRAAVPHLVWEATALPTTPEPSDIRPGKWPPSHSRPPAEIREAAVSAARAPDFSRLRRAFRTDPARRPQATSGNTKADAPGPLRRPLHPPELRPDHRGPLLARVTPQPPPQGRFRRSEALRAMDFASRRRSCNVVPATPTGKKNRRKAKRS